VLDRVSAAEAELSGGEDMYIGVSLLGVILLIVLLLILL
jgi:hypothetical protein